jgi:hypothetical protein
MASSGDEGSMRKILIIFVLVSLTGCMTTAGLVTGPITGPISMVRQASKEGSFKTTLISGVGFGILMIPVGMAATAAAGFQKDYDYWKYGTYTEPGTMRVRFVFDPWAGFPKHRDPEVENYPGKPAMKNSPNMPPNQPLEPSHGPAAKPQADQ